MNLKNIVKYLSVLAFAVSTSSCDDFLTQKNINEILQSEYYTNVEKCNTALTGVYNALKNINVYTLSDDMLRTDLAMQGTSQRTSYTNESYIHSYSDSYGAVNNKWSAIFTIIKRANDLIDNAELYVRSTIETTAEETRLERILAEAKALRAIAYYFLHVTFRHTDGNCAPLITKALSDPDDLSFPLASPDAIRDFYRSELVYAIDNGLTDETLSEDEGIGHITTYAAYAILGMSYLEQATETSFPEGSDLDMESCYLAAENYFAKIINSGKYSLVADPKENSTTYGEYNSESIFEINYTLSDNSELSGESLLYSNNAYNISGVKGNGLIMPPLWLVETFQNEKPDPLDESNWIDIPKDPFFGKSYYNKNGYQVYIYDCPYVVNGEAVVLDEYQDPENPKYRVYTSMVHMYDSSILDGPRYKDILYTRTITYDPTVDEDDVERVRTVVYTAYSVYMGYRRIMAYADFYKQPTSYQEQAIFEPNVYDPTVNGGTQATKRLRMFSERASNSVALVNDVDLMFYEYTPIEKATYGNNRTCYFRKYTNWAIWSDEDQSSPANKSGINHRLIRLADIYLGYAEALIRGGREDANLNTALNYVNMLRRRGGAILIGSDSQTSLYSSAEATFDGDQQIPQYQSANGLMTAKELMHHLMYVERPLELCLDGYHTRLIDMRRWRTDDNTGLTRDISKERFTLLASNAYRYYLETCYGVKRYGVETNSFAKMTKYLTYQVRYTPADAEYVTEEGKSLYTDYESAATAYDPSNISTVFWPISNDEKISNPYIN